MTGAAVPSIIVFMEFLHILLIVAMAATLIVLAVGIVSFAFSGKLSERHGTKLMTARVVLQLVAIAILGALVLFSVV